MNVPAGWHIARRVARILLFALIAAMPAALLASFFRLESASFTMKCGIAALAALGAVARRPALLILAAAVPVATSVTGLSGSAIPAAVSAEAAVVAVLLGQTFRAIGLRRDPYDWPEAAAFALAGLAVASAVAQVSPLHLRIGMGVPFGEWLRTFLAHDYFLRRSEMRPVFDAALLAQGCALFVISRRESRDLASRDSLLRGLVAGAAAAAALNIGQLFTMAARAPDPWRALVEGVTSVRLNVQHGDPNAAGSYFVMLLCVALAAPMQPALRWTAAAVIAAGVWLAGSRSAMASLVVAAAATFVLLALFRRGFQSRRVAVLATIALIAGALVVAALWPRSRANMQLQWAMAYRVDMTRAAVQMLRDQPLLGVGIGEFAPQSSYRRPADPQTGLPPAAENAHNNFLQIAAELGLPGLLAMLALLWAVGWTLTTKLRIGHDVPVTTAALAGLLAFVLTWLFGHPLLVPLVAYPFWIALGAAAAVTTATIAPATRGATPALAIASLAIVASIPFRTELATRSTALEHIAVNFSPWMIDGSGHEYRRAANCSGVYVPGGAAAIVVPLKPDDQATLPVTVEFMAEGRVAGGFRLDARDWVEVRVRLAQAGAPGASRFVSLRAFSGDGQSACDAVSVNVGKVIGLDSRGQRL